jgi:hypothetical protein
MSASRIIESMNEAITISDEKLENGRYRVHISEKTEEAYLKVIDIETEAVERALAS